MQQYLYYIQTIFGPDQRQFDRNLRSLQSLSDYLKIYPFKIKFVIGGWCKTDDMWNQLQNVIEKFNFEYSITKFDNNYGKSYVVNTLFDAWLRDKEDQFFLTADSDICFDAELCPNIFNRLLQAPFYIEQNVKKPFGLIALNQAQSNCHIHDALNLSFTYQNYLNQTEIMKYPSNIGGIAGGCLFTHTSVWKKVNGYRLINVYGGDDGFYLLDVYTSGHACVMSDSISIIHPYDTDQEYAQWKHDQIKYIHTYGGHSRPLEQYMDSEKFAKDFWKSK